MWINVHFMDACEKNVFTHNAKRTTETVFYARRAKYLTSCTQISAGKRFFDARVMKKYLHQDTIFAIIFRSERHPFTLNFGQNYNFWEIMAKMTFSPQFLKNCVEIAIFATINRGENSTSTTICLYKHCFQTCFLFFVCRGQILTHTANLNIYFAFIFPFATILEYKILYKHCFKMCVLFFWHRALEHLVLSLANSFCTSYIWKYISCPWFRWFKIYKKFFRSDPPYRNKETSTKKLYVKFFDGLYAKTSCAT